MRAYATEEFYKAEYLGEKEPVISAGFPFYARDASRVLDRYTFDRLKDRQKIPEAVQMCCCELAEQIYRATQEDTEIAGKTSERIGSYSVSFASPEEKEKLRASRKREIVMKWLGDTGLCYQGV